MRNDLVKEIQSKMEHCHYVIFPDHDPELRCAYTYVYVYFKKKELCFIKNFFINKQIGKDRQKILK